MADERRRSEPGASANDSFEALLKQAAHVSGPAVSSLGAQLQPGSTLLGGRLRIMRRIGEGGMGVVYEAHDERRRGSVALKTLSRLDAANVYRLKNEFRSLADVSHPSLCRLHELFADGEQWFFTMELVDGERFDSWVRPAGVLDEARLRAALPQLREGITAIHAAGKLHRDLKPSNVLVSAEGRVVVLDFGLAVDPELGGVGHTLIDESVSGTPAYMAPEQAAGAPATAASDFYALGVMLFEALTGKLPFDGRIGEMLAAKQHSDAPMASTLQPGVPRDLASLCDVLLAREPAARPDGAMLGATLGVPVHTTAPRSLTPRGGSATDAGESLLGREHELAALREAYAATLSGRCVVVFVSGESGVGKSALVDTFLSELRADSAAVVLAGRCYERESVPYKAFDTLVDELSRHLRKLPREEAAGLMPREVFALARLFPVLDRIDAVLQAPKKAIPDPQELQLRAFAAFGELLGRIRDRRPLVVYFDDLQWADQDSTVFMNYLLVHREPVPALMIASHRSEGDDDNTLLQQMLQGARKNPKIDGRTVALQRLSPAAAQALVQRLLRGADDRSAASIAAESQGSPFFVGELVRQLRVSGAGLAQLTLKDAVLRHVQDLGIGARVLLEVLAVAGRPLAVQLALDAAETAHDAVDVLVAERLLRVAGAGAERTLECYHDKIRESVGSALTADALRATHRRLAVTLSAHADVDPEHLALHWHGAGERERAAAYYEQAAEASALALAFEYAARQFEQALVLGSYEQERARGVRIKLGAALAAAGRSREAAHVYRDAAATASAEQSLELTREAARLLMTSGYVDEGRVLLGEVLATIGLALPRSRRGAIAGALWSRARLKLRGFALRAAPGAAVSRETEAHLGGLWTVAQGAIGTDPFLMVEMSARYARLALDSGSRRHAVRALATEAYLVSFDGMGTRAQTEALLAQATKLGKPEDEPEVFSWVQVIRGSVLVHQGGFAESRSVHAQALSWLQQRCTAVSFELACARIYDQLAAIHLGELAELSTTTPALLEDALRRGDMWPATMLASGMVMPAWLAHRGPSDARARFEEAKRHYQRQSNYHWPDYTLLLAELSLALHEGHARHGLALAAEQWQSLERAQLLRMHMARGLLRHARGGCALAVVRDGGAGSGAERSIVSSDIRSLQATRLPHTPGWAAALEAGLALQDRKPERAAERLRSAIACYDVTGLRMYAAAARRRLGQLLGGDEGKTLLAAGDAAMAVESVLDLESTTEMLVPGCRS